jgi:GTPase SAR1 family protein
MERKEFFERMNRTKQHVLDVIGSVEARATIRQQDAYLVYIGLCHEAQIALDTNELDVEILKQLDEYAEKVILLIKN